MSTAASDDWKKDWDRMKAAVGQDFSGGVPQVGADAVDAGGIRRYLELLEFDCPLHYDAEVARRHGYRDIIHMTCGAGPMAIPPQWKPGGPTIFNSADAHAQLAEVLTKQGNAEQARQHAAEADRLRMVSPK